MNRLFTLLVLASLVGCSNIPETVAECSKMFANKAEIEKCEKAVIKREDMRFKRKYETRINSLAAERCWQMGKGVWHVEKQYCDTTGIF